MTDLTGVLLLGGASTRFGSPKALATLRGETLAERAWRTLGEACEERLAVGKADLGLPFEVRLEPAEPQAPIAGLVEALSASPTDAVVALPVDCPLVTPQTVRALGDALAVPPTGPLPGGYSKADLPELESRLARGDYSLRGVNPRVLEVDPADLLDVDTPRDLALAAAVAWARAHEDVRALVLVGSLARADTPADEWSDVDLVALVDDAAPYLGDGAWVEELGRPVLTFLEPAAVGDIQERRVLLEGGVDVDIVPVPVARADDLLGPAAVVFRRGYRVLHDEIGIADRLAHLDPEPDPQSLPSEAELEQHGADLWYHGLWTAKKLARGELWTAHGCLECYLRYRLVTLLRWRSQLDGATAWHEARFLERWAGEPPETLAATYGSHDEEGIRSGLWGMLELASRVEAELGEGLGFAPVDRSEVRALVEAVQPR